MKILNGKDLAGYIKERQAHEVAGMRRKPRLAILRDSDNPVITKYVQLKQRYGDDIGVEVVDVFAAGEEALRARILEANADSGVDGVIIQLPLLDKELTDELTGMIAPEKDVDGLSGREAFDSATATAILWLLAGYDINLTGKKVAIVGRGKLVGAPLFKMLSASGVEAEIFHRGSDLAKLKDFDIIVTATGVPGLITPEMVAPGTVIVDAGTASEHGILVGDVAPEVRERGDLAAITPVVGGVGPLTVTCLFEHVIEAARGRM